MPRLPHVGQPRATAGERHVSPHSHMSIESPTDLAGMKRVGRVVADVLETMRRSIRPGLTTGELDAIAAARLAMHGARSAPRTEYQFPGYTCISVNEEIVHGIPGDRVIAAG